MSVCVKIVIKIEIEKKKKKSWYIIFVHIAQPYRRPLHTIIQTRVLGGSKSYRSKLASVIPIGQNVFSEAG